MTKIESKEIFAKWRKWFLEQVKFEIFRYNGLAYLGDESVLQIVKLPPVPEIRTIQEQLIRSKRKFIRGFEELCAKQGLNLIREQENWKSMGSDNAYWSTVGNLGSPLTVECLMIYSLLNKRLKQDIQRMKEFESSPPLQPKRRTPDSLSRTLLYILEKLKGSQERIEPIKVYFNRRGDFSKDLNDQFDEIKKLTKRLKRKRSKRANTDYSHEPTLPPYLLNLERSFDLMLEPGKNEHSAKAGASKWAAHWRQDLTRVLLSEGKPIKKQRFSTAGKKLLIDSILIEGDKKLGLV